MTVNTATSTATYTGNGSTTSFPVSFYFLVNTDLQVLQKVAATGLVKTLGLNSDYTLTGAGVESGGTLTMTVAPAAGDTLYIARNVSAVQQTAYPTNSPFPAASHEMALDRLTMLAQQIQTAGALALQRSPLAATYDLGNNTLINENTAVNAADVPNLQQVQTLVAAAAGGVLPGSIALTANLASTAAGKGAALIGFQQSGTGAVARTVQQELSDSVSVKQFGAKGDGVTDDLASINAAIAYLGTLGGGVLLFPKACLCAVTNTVNVNAANIILQFEGLTSGIKPIAAMTDLIAISADGCRVINGNFSNNASYATNAINRTGSASFGTQVIGNYIASFVNGVTWSASGNNGLLAHDNFFNSLTNAAFNFTEDGRTSTITNNVINGGKYGLYADFVTQQLEGLIFTGNSVFPTISGGSSIYAHGCLYWVISGNVLDAYGSGVTLNFASGTTTHQAAYVTVANNHIGISASSNGFVTSGNCTYFKIRENTFDGASGSVGLNMTGSSFCRVTDNEFVNLTGTQISLTGVTYSNFMGNQLRGSGTPASEDATSQNIWVGNYGAVNPKSPSSYFLWNWQDDVLSTESDWASFTPSLSATSGTFTTASATGSYRRLGKTIEVNIVITITTNGTAAGQILVGLPVVARGGSGQVLTAGQNAPSIYGCNAFVNAAAASTFVNKYDGTYPGLSGSQIYVSGVYIAA